MQAVHVHRAALATHTRQAMAVEHATLDVTRIGSSRSTAMPGAAASVYTTAWSGYHTPHDTRVPGCNEYALQLKSLGCAGRSA